MPHRDSRIFTHSEKFENSSKRVTLFPRRAGDGPADGWAAEVEGTIFLRRGDGEFDEGETITLAAFGELPAEVPDHVPF